MKLNLGCGGDYKKDYINIDAFDSTVADRIMSSTDIKLSNNTVDEVLIYQLIEHLGIAGSIYTLSECFRVLKPKKQLLIETPDLQKSFEIYVKGEREDRKNILPWIYGVDIPGMSHRFCYPDDLLEETLQKIGFTNIKKEFIESDKYQPTLRVTCKKPIKYEVFQIITFFRKRLLQDKIVNIEDQLTTLEQENLIEFFTGEINNFRKTNDPDTIKKIVTHGATCSPAMTYIFIEEMIRQKMISPNLSKKYLETLKILAKIDFPNVLLQILKQTPDFVGEQEKLFKTIYIMGTKTIEKLFDPGERDDVVSNLQRLSREIVSHEKIAFFSPKLIMLKANRLFQIGSKEFFLRKYEKAISSFMESANLYREQILTYWNLGRLLRLQKKTEEAIFHYKNALGLIDVFDDENKRLIKRFLEQEMDGCNVSVHSKPITSLNEL